MRRPGFLAVGALIGVGSIGVPAAAAAWTAPGKATVERLAGLPLHFEPNLGQTDTQVRFHARGSGYGVYLTQAEMVVVLATPPSAAGGQTVPRRRVQADRLEARTTALRMAFVGADLRLPPLGEEPLAGHSNYFVGNEPTRWRANVPQYARVRYSEIYPGTDIVFYGNQRQLEYDLVLKPGADPGKIRLRISGAQSTRINGAGDLVLATGSGEIIQKAPVVYQEKGGRRDKVSGRYVAEGGHEFRFELGAFDRAAALVIDPVLLYSTYLGGSGGEGLAGLAVDGTGNLYVGGGTTSTDFPTTTPYQGSYGGGASDVVVFKLDPSGSTLLYSTYLGGSGQDTFWNLAVDPAGNVFVGGSTSSPNFPTASAFRGSPAGGEDAFLAKLGPSGSTLVYSTYFGGTLDDSAASIAVDAAGNLYAAGQTSSPTIPGVTPSLFGYASPCTSPCSDAFVLKLNSAGSAVAWFTYLGGANGDYAVDIAVDASGGAVVTGQTFSTNFPIQNPIRPTNSGGDGFVTKVNPAGNALTFSTYFAGSGNGVAMDAANDIYLTGVASAGFTATPGAFQTSSGGMTDVYAAKLNASGQQILYATFLGGSEQEFPYAIRVDPGGNAYLAGSTRSSNFPVVNPTQAFGGGTCGSAPTFPCPDAYVVKLSPNGSSLGFATFLGGSGDDAGRRITTDGAGNVFVVGQTRSANFPTRNARDAGLSGPSDGFVVKIGEPSGGGPMRAFTVAPCRLIDTREPDGPLAGPILAPGQERTFTLVGVCGISSSARAISVNVTVVAPGDAGFLTLFPGDEPRPATSSINFSAGQVRANSGVFRLPADGTGRLTVLNGSAGSTHVLIDVNATFE